MLSTLFGLYLSDKYNAKSDIVLWSQPINASETLNLTLIDAINGSALKSSLATHDFIITNYTIWTQNSIVQIEILPDNESTHKIKTYALSQKISAPLIPPKLVQTDIILNLTETQGIADDIVIVLDVIKVPQTNTLKLIDLIDTLTSAIENIDLQTLGAQKLLMNSYYQNNTIIQQNNIMILQLNALIKLNGGTPLELPPTITLPHDLYLPPDITTQPGYYSAKLEGKIVTPTCRRI